MASATWRRKPTASVHWGRRRRRATYCGRVAAPPFSRVGAESARERVSCKPKAFLLFSGKCNLAAKVTRSLLPPARGAVVHSQIMATKLVLLFLAALSPAAAFTIPATAASNRGALMQSAARTLLCRALLLRRCVLLAST